MRPSSSTHRGVGKASAPPTPRTGPRATVTRQATGLRSPDLRSPSSASDPPVRQRASGNSEAQETPAFLSSTGLRGLPEVGARVTFKVASKEDTGIVRWVGQLSCADGDWIGIEISTPKGKNDGSGPDGHQYFQCPPKHGLFVRASSILSVEKNDGDSAKDDACSPALSSVTSPTNQVKQNAAESTHPPKRLQELQAELEAERKSRQEQAEEVTSLMEQLATTIAQVSSFEVEEAAAASETEVLESKLEVEQSAYASEEQAMQTEFENELAIHASQEEATTSRHDEQVAEVNRAAKKQQAAMQAEIDSLKADVESQLLVQQAQAQEHDTFLAATRQELRAARAAHEAACASQGAAQAEINAQNHTLQSEQETLVLSASQLKATRHQLESSQAEARTAEELEEKMLAELRTLHAQLLSQEEEKASLIKAEAALQAFQDDVRSKDEMRESEIQNLQTVLHDKEDARRSHSEEHEASLAAVRQELQTAQAAHETAAAARSAAHVQLETQGHTLRSESDTLASNLSQLKALGSQIEAAKAEGHAAEAAEEAASSEVQALRVALASQEEATQAEIRTLQAELHSKKERNSSLANLLAEQELEAGEVACRDVEGQAFASDVQTLKSKLDASESAAFASAMRARAAETEAGALRNLLKAEQATLNQHTEEALQYKKSHDKLRAETKTADEEHKEALEKVCTLMADLALREKDCALMKHFRKAAETADGAKREALSELEALKGTLREEEIECSALAESHQQEIGSLADMWRQELEATQNAHFSVMAKQRKTVTQMETLKEELNCRASCVSRASTAIGDQFATEAGDKVNTLKEALGKVKSLMKDVKKSKVDKELLREELSQSLKENAQKTQELDAWRLHVEATKMELKVETQAYLSMERAARRKTLEPPAGSVPSRRSARYASSVGSTRSDGFSPPDRKDSTAEGSTKAGAPRGSFFSWLNSEPDTADSY